MKQIVGVMGAGEKQATPKTIEQAYEVGKLVGLSGAVLLCGGMSGVMEASARGSQELGGLTIGIGPTKEKNDMNDYIDIPLLTGMHAGRNYMNILSSDVLIFVGVESPGTLSELAFAIQLEKPILIINYSERLRDYMGEFKNSNITFINSLEDLNILLKKLIH